MMTHIQHNEAHPVTRTTTLPKAPVVAVGSGFTLAVLLFAMSLPLMAAAGLWLLGLSVALIGYALVAHRHFEVAAWDTAIIGQVCGLLGTAILFGASLLGQ